MTPDNPEKTAIEALVEQLRGPMLPNNNYESARKLCLKAADALSHMAGEPRIVVRWEGNEAWVGQQKIARIIKGTGDSDKLWFVAGTIDCLSGLFHQDFLSESTARSAVAQSAIEALTMKRDTK